LQNTVNRLKVNSLDWIFLTIFLEREQIPQAHNNHAGAKSPSQWIPRKFSTISDLLSRRRGVLWPDSKYSRTQLLFNFLVKT
jgi:hypothetical protein